MPVTPTIWDVFVAKRRHSSRKFIHRSLLRIVFGWSVYLFLTIFPLTLDDHTSELLPYFAAFQGAQTMLLVFAIIVTGCEWCKESYTLIVTMTAGSLILLNFTRGIVVDLLVHHNEFYSYHGNSGNMNDATAGTAIASRIFGPHEILVTIVAFDTARLIILDRKYRYFLFLGVPVTMVIICLLLVSIGEEASLQHIPVEHMIFSLLKVILCVMTSFVAAKMRINNEWKSYVIRKRLQLECVRTEEILKLAMPPKIANEQMMGRIEPVRHNCASVGFIYIENYAEFVLSTSTSGEYRKMMTTTATAHFACCVLKCVLAGKNVMYFMKAMNYLFSKLDELVLSHKNVYKIENVANCYMVSCNAPYVSVIGSNTPFRIYAILSVMVCAYELQQSPYHAKDLLDFCFQVMETYKANKFSFCYTENAKVVTKSLDLKIGLHCGPVTSAVIGRSRTFFRLFGDTVNVASRIGGVAKHGQIVGTREFYEELIAEGNKSQSQDLCPSKQEFYESKYQGEVHLKGKGLKSYFQFQATSTNLLVGDSSNLGASSSDDFLVNIEGHQDVLDKTLETNHGFWKGRDSMFIDSTREFKGTNTILSNEASIQGSFGSQYTASVQYNQPDESLQTLRKSQRLIASASRLLRVPQPKCLEEYKVLSENSLSIHSRQYIKRIERMAIRQFVQSSLRSRHGRKGSTKFLAQTPRSLPERRVNDLSFRSSNQVKHATTETVAITPEHCSQNQEMAETKTAEGRRRSEAMEANGQNTGESSEIRADADEHTYSKMSSIDNVLLPLQEFSKNSRNSSWFGRIHSSQARFPDQALEDMYERRGNEVSYSTVDGFSGSILLILFIFIALYYHFLRGKEGVLAVLGVTFGVALFLGNSTLKRFRWLTESKSTDDYISNVKHTQYKERRNNIDETGRQCMNSVDMSSQFDREEEIPGTCAATVVKLKRWYGKKTKSLSHWLVAIILLFSSVLLALDQLYMRQRKREGCSHEICLRSFILPAFLLAVVHIIGLCTRAQIITQSGIILVYLVFFSATGLLFECNGYIQSLGFLCVLAVAINGVTECRDSEFRSRRALVAQLASKKANDQADAVANRLFPPYVTKTLKENKPMPFEDVHNDVVILWADLVGFTALSSTLDCFQVAQILDELYSKFDDQVEREGMWKMDTIGDAYIIIGGLVDDSEVKSSILVNRMFSLGVNMLDQLRIFNNEQNTDIALRIGIHAGQVGTGIVGKLRPRYYVFGEDVLHAEHMESTGKAGCIHVSKVAANKYKEVQFSLLPENGDETGLGNFWLESWLDIDITLRIGIHVGQFVGKLRPRYDVVGEIVLDAEHMDSTGKAGCIHVFKAATNKYWDGKFSLHPENRPSESDVGNVWSKTGHRSSFHCPGLCIL